MATDKPKKTGGKRSADDKPARKGAARGGAGAGKKPFSARGEGDERPARAGARGGAAAGRGPAKGKPGDRSGTPGSRGGRKPAPGSDTGRGYRRPADDFNEFSEDSYRALETGSDSGSRDRKPRTSRDTQDRFAKRKTPFSGNRDAGFGSDRKPPFKGKPDSNRFGGDRPSFDRKPGRFNEEGGSDRKPARNKKFAPATPDELAAKTRRPTGYKSTAKRDSDDRKPARGAGKSDWQKDDRGPRKSSDRSGRDDRPAGRKGRSNDDFASDDRPVRAFKPRPAADEADGMRKSYSRSDRDERPASPRKGRSEDDAPSEDRPVRPYKPRGAEDRAAAGSLKKVVRKDDSDKFSKDKPARKPRGEKADEAPEYNLERYEKRSRGKRENETEEQIRLNRFISNAGVCSRREADALIAAGEIKVNGQVVTEMGYLVSPSDTVQYGKKILNREKLVYVLLNKPKDFITTTEDPEDRKTVMELVANASKERIFPVGRLDRNTTGLLLFTNDGELAQKLSHPSHTTSKVYQIELDKPLTEEHEEQIKAGLELEDGRADIDDIAILAPDRMAVGLELHIGRNRIVRRIFEHLGYDVVKLDRVSYAGLTKKDLPRGNWRYLTEKEVIRLKYFD